VETSHGAPRNWLVHLPQIVERTKFCPASAVGGAGGHRSAAVFRGRAAKGRRGVTRCSL
jgi:hypothetical protein